MSEANEQQQDENQAQGTNTAGEASAGANDVAAGADKKPETDQPTDGVDPPPTVAPTTASGAAAASPQALPSAVTLAQSFKDRKAKLEAELADLKAEAEKRRANDNAEIQAAIDAKHVEISELDKTAGQFLPWLEHDVGAAWNSIRSFFAGLGQHGL
jgi:hypothetical protein